MICTSDDTDCENTIKEFPFMNICKTARISDMMEIKHFKQGLIAYTGTNKPYDIIDTNYDIIYLDSSKLFSCLDEAIDCSDFTKIYLKPQQFSSSKVMVKTLNVRSTGGTSDVNRLADILEKQYQGSHYFNQENLGKWDTATQTGIPQEVITRYDNMKDANFVITNLIKWRRKRI